MQSVYAVKRAFLVYYRNRARLKRRKSPEPLEILDFYIGGDEGAPPLSLPLLAHIARSLSRHAPRGGKTPHCGVFLVRPSGLFELLPKVKRSPFGGLLLGGAPPLSLPLLAHTARSSGRLRYARRENAALWRFLVRPSSPFELLPKVKRSPFGDLLLWWGWKGSSA